MPLHKTTLLPNTYVLTTHWKEPFYQQDIHEIKNKLDNATLYYNFHMGNDSKALVIAPPHIPVELYANSNPDKNGYSNFFQDFFDAWKLSNEIHWNMSTGFNFLFQTHVEQWYTLQEYLSNKELLDRYIKI